jgi:hypothetical protein
MMQPFPTEPTPDDLAGLDQAASPARSTDPAVRLPGRIQLRRLTRGHVVALAAVGVVAVGSFLPWYQAHVSPIHGWSAIDPCPPTLHGSDHQICEDEHSGGSVVTVTQLTWAAWNTPRAWLAVLVVLAFGAVLIRQVMPEHRPLPGMALVGLVALTDLIVLQAIVFLPSPGPDLGGHKVPGDQAWRLTWGIYVVLAGMVAMTIAIAIDYIHAQRAAGSVNEARQAESCSAGPQD